MHLLERRRRGLPDHRQQYINVRERWATLTNEALREANIAARIDHRSLAAQGIDREPLPVIPMMHLKMERRGLHSDLAEHLRAEYRERVAGRRENTVAPVGPASGPSEKRAVERSADTPGASADVEEIRRRAREAWLQLRSKGQQVSSGQSLNQSQETEREADAHDSAASGLAQDDLAL
jgi:MobA/MobL family